LLTSGKVLVAGGSASDEAAGAGTIRVVQPAAQQTTATAEVYDPATGIWSPTGSMSVGRSWHTATLLPSGKVLVAGGFVTAVPAWTAQPTATAEVYDPATGTWSPTGSMSTGRWMHTATLLPNGKVLVAGGLTGLPGVTAEATTTAEVYNPATGTWTPTGRMSVGRLDHTATLLPSGKVLIAGGQWQRPPVPGNPNARIFGDPMAAAEAYDPSTGVWTPTGKMSTGRAHHTATLLVSGKVLVAGGETKFVGPSTATAEVYDPLTGTWAPTGSMSATRASHTATLLRSARVLVVGGTSDGFRYTNTGEVYGP
jgi:N-acetylneuraminic acid mutarotase